MTAWVEVPTLSASADTEIYIYYGNADAADQWNITGTWDEGGNNNFKGVWHLKESLTGASGEVKDSTGANDGTGIPTNASYTGPSGGDTGQIDNAVYFDATDDGVEMSDFFGAWTSATLEAWVNITTYSSWDAILGQPHTSFADPYVTTALALHTSNNFYMSISVDGLTRTIASSADNSAPTGAWIHVVGVWNGTNIQMYVNGSTSGSPASISGNLYNNTENVYIGYYPLSFPNYLFDGTIDEVRVSDTDRSADWIATCYNNQSDTTIGAGHFIKEVGSEEVGGWESYKESAHATPWGTEADPYDTDTQTVYMYGEGFATSYAYRVAYYDAPGTKTEDAHKIQAHDTDSGASGNLSSQYLLSTPEKQASSDPGTWHAIVCDRTYEPPSSYNATWQYTIVDDSFEVTAGAIPEFPTVLAALAVVGLCCGVYFWMRRRTARVKA